MATTVGTVYLNGCNYQLKYDLLSQNVANNTSTVRLYGVLNVTNSYISWTRGTASVHTSGAVSIGTYYSKGSYTLLSRDFTWSHDANGNFSSYIGASLSTTFVSGNTGGTITLPSIPRNAKISTAPNFNDEENPTITYNNPLGNSASSVMACISLTGSTDDIVYRDIPKTGTLSYTFELTDAERNLLRQNTTGKTRKVKFFIRTVIGGSTLYSIVEKTFSIINASPTYNEAYLDTNPTSVAITHNDQQLIQNISTLRFNLTNCTALKYATLSSAKVSINGVDYPASTVGSSITIDVGTLNLSNEIEAIVSVTDSRGFITTKNVNLQILEWSIPTGLITLNRQNNFYSTTYIKVDANYSSLDDKNEITIKVRYKKITDASYSNWVNLQDNVQSTLNLDNNYQWNVQVLVQDKTLGSTTYNLTLDRGIPIVFFDRLKRSVGINSFPKNNESLEVLDGDLLNILGIRNDTWVSGQTYAKGEIVCYNRTLYEHLTTVNSGTPDTDTTNWQETSILVDD